MVEKNKHYIIKLAVLFICVYSFHLIIKVAPGDDTWFSDVSDQFSFLSYLKFRYNEWSGRMPAEAALYYFLDGRIWIWRIINTGMIVSLGYLIVRIIKEKVQFREILAAILLLGFFSHSIMSSGLLWITGSMNYLWPICGALFAMIPFADYSLRGRFAKGNTRLVLCGIIGLLSACSNEQVALCMISFSVISIFHSFFTNKSWDIKLMFLTIIFVTGALILFLAPGNDKRYIAETATWFPGFDLLSIKDHIYIGVIWIFNKTTFEMQYIILMISTVSIVVMYKKYDKMRLIQSALLYVFSCMFLIVVFTKIMGSSTSLLYDFTAIQKFNFGYEISHIWRLNFDFLVAIVPYIFWILYYMLLSFIIFLVTDRSLFVILTLLASIATMVVMFVSPTIYASASRVLTVASVLIMLVIVNIFIRFNLLSFKVTWVIFCTFSTINILTLFISWVIHGYTPVL
ncbi:DUF6056 family protein [Paenibacillus sp. FSL H7-0714]|uniref:DUF6056 family protein n=1 Tax=Paenibacillus sp. FSL H7-0714 TaxID=2954735 RepID=UPI0030F4D4B4